MCIKIERKVNLLVNGRKGTCDWNQIKFYYRLRKFSVEYSIVWQMIVIGVIKWDLIDYTIYF